MCMTLLQLSNLQAWGIFLGILSVSISVVVLLVQLRYSFKGLKDSVDDIGDDVSTLSSSVSRIEGYLVGINQPPESTDGGQVELSEFEADLGGSTKDLNEIYLSRQLVYRYEEGIFSNNPVVIAVETPIGDHDNNVVKISFDSEYESVLEGLAQLLTENEEEIRELINNYGFQQEKLSLVPRLEVSLVVSGVDDMTEAVVLGKDIMDYYDMIVRESDQEFYNELFD